MTNILILSFGFFGLAALAAAVWVVLAVPRIIREAVANYLETEDAAAVARLELEIDELQGYLDEANEHIAALSSTALARRNQELSAQVDRARIMADTGRRPDLDDVAQQKRAGDR